MRTRNFYLLLTSVCTLAACGGPELTLVEDVEPRQSLEQRADGPTPGKCFAPVPLTFDAAGVATVTRAGPQPADSSDVFDTANEYGISHSAPLDRAYSSCPGLPGPGDGKWQTVYSFTQLRGGPFSATAVGTRANRPSLFLRKLCHPGEPAPYGTDLACGDTVGFEGRTASVSLAWLPAGNYLLIANTAYQGGTGEYVLTVTRPTVQVVANDTCATARTILTGGATSASFDVDLSGADANYVGTCVDARAAATGKDAVYRFSLSSPRRVRVSATGSSPADAVIYLRRGSCQGPEVPAACADHRYGGTETLDVTVSAGDYFLFIDGYDAAGSGRQAVTVTTSAAAIDLGALDWKVTADGFSVGTRLTGVCGPEVTPTPPGDVTGTDVYTNDSSICAAAAHVGIVSRATGGPVTIEIRPGEASYLGSTRNEVITSGWWAWHRSFVVLP